MKGIEHLAAVAEQYHWSRVAALGVTQHSDGAEGDELESPAAWMDGQSRWASAMAA